MTNITLDDVEYSVSLTSNSLPFRKTVDATIQEGKVVQSIKLEVTTPITYNLHKTTSNEDEVKKVTLQQEGDKTILSIGKATCSLPNPDHIYKIYRFKVQFSFADDSEIDNALLTIATTQYLMGLKLFTSESFDPEAKEVFACCTIEPKYPQGSNHKPFEPVLDPTKENLLTELGWNNHPYPVNKKRLNEGLYSYMQKDYPGSNVFGHSLVKGDNTVAKFYFLDLLNPEAMAATFGETEQETALIVGESNTLETIV